MSRSSLSSLSTTLQQIRSSLPTRARAFDDARARHAALAAHGSSGEVLAALGRTSPLSVDDRDAILLAVLAELSLSGDPIWQSLLLVAFEPMLVGLRRRSGHVRDEDLDRDVLLAFLDAARTVRVRSHAARVLRLATEERVFAHRRAERRAPEMLEFDEETHAGDPRDAAVRESAAAAEMARVVEARGGAELRDALLATYGSEESLREYVDRTHRGSSAKARASTYDRLCRARLRIVAELRERKGCRAPRSLGACAA